MKKGKISADQLNNNSKKKKETDYTKSTQFSLLPWQQESSPRRKMNCGVWINRSKFYFKSMLRVYFFYFSFSFSLHFLSVSFSVSLAIFVYKQQQGQEETKVGGRYYHTLYKDYNHLTIKRLLLPFFNSFCLFFFSTNQRQHRVYVNKYTNEEDKKETR